MILYNMRERGALEYDKFALNILQISNAILLEEFYEFSDNTNSLIEMQAGLEALKNKVIKLSDDFYLKNNRKFK